MRESRLGKARPSGKCELLVNIVLPHPPLVALLLPLVGGEIYIYTHHIQIRDAVLTQFMRSPHPFGSFSLGPVSRCFVFFFVFVRFSMRISKFQRKCALVVISIYGPKVLGRAFDFPSALALISEREFKQPFLSFRFSLSGAALLGHA